MRTIILKNYLNVYNEFVAGEAGIYPGHLVEIKSTGKINLFDGEGARTLLLIAKEDELQGKTTRDVFTSGEVVQCFTPQRGDEVLLRLAIGESVVIGDKLTPTAGGEVKKFVGDSGEEGYIIGQAIAAVDLTPSVLPATGQFVKCLIW